jgi:hypothetical protein
MRREQFDLPIARFARGGLPGLHFPRSAPSFPLELVLSDGVYLLKLRDDEGKVLGRISFDDEGLPVYEPPLPAGSYRKDQIPIQDDLRSWTRDCWRRHEGGERPLPISFAHISKPPA